MEKGRDGAVAPPLKMLDRKRGCAANAVLVAFIVTVPSMAILFGARSSASALWIGSANASRLGAHDRLLGGLLADDGFNERSCHSRFEFATYRRSAGRKPSPYLVTKLRRHEALQRRCGPGTAAYSDAVEQLQSGKSHPGAIGSPECRVVLMLLHVVVAIPLSAVTTVNLLAGMIILDVMNAMAIVGMTDLAVVAITAVMTETEGMIDNIEIVVMIEDITAVMIEMGSVVMEVAVVVVVAVAVDGRLLALSTLPVRSAPNMVTLHATVGGAILIVMMKMKIDLAMRRVHMEWTLIGIWIPAPLIISQDS
ncbi:hypothetical protein QYE76_027407 [Lolium multiflorum]|uniref:Fucosyltransferase n=1 Tax=Lolium multiflorum TaxID=4521 RepID=A0AAD8QMB8_LOLMU|nr:hypothetical protein QYE76_027407 [Lolium multiflorum]